MDVLTGALALSLWVASGSLVLAIADGMGEHPTRRITLGAVLVGASAILLWRRRDTARVLRAAPWLVLPLAAAELTVAAADGVIGGAYVSFSLTAIGIAVVVARARTVWYCVALLGLGYATAVLVSQSPASLTADGHLGGVLGAMVSYPVAAMLFLGLRRRFDRFVAAVEPTLEHIRAGATTFTPELGRVVAGHQPLALPAPPPPKLTATERLIVEALATGLAAKEIARARGVSLPTVRTHIANAKRKTGARTLRELATLPARRDWQTADDGH
jgi:DNA-binding CsgD family transcriptional regulator